MSVPEINTQSTQSSQITNIPTNVIEFLHKDCPNCKSNLVIGFTMDTIVFNYEGTQYELTYGATSQQLLNATHICNCCDVSYIGLPSGYVYQIGYKRIVGFDMTNTILYSCQSALIKLSNINHMIKIAHSSNLDTKIAKVAVEIVETVETTVVNIAKVAVEPKDALKLITKEDFKALYAFIEARVDFEHLNNYLLKLGLTVDKFLTIEVFAELVNMFSHDWVVMMIRNIIKQKAGAYSDEVLGEPKINNDWSMELIVKILHIIQKGVGFPTTYITAIINAVETNKNTLVIDYLVNDYKLMFDLFENKYTTIQNLVRKLSKIDSDLARKVIASIAPHLV